MEYANPKYLFLLLLLIPLIVWYILKLKNVQANFMLSTTSAFRGMSPSPRVYLRHIPFILRLGAIALMIIVLARPQDTHSTDKSKSEGIDIVLALDVSGSMTVEDFKPDRLTAAKRVAAEFINSRPNDNIGLVTFAGESFTQCPLTTDHRTLLNLLNEVRNGLIEDGTAIGMGLANAVNRLKDSPSQSRVVILLTDGSNNRGIIAPLTAAELAESYGIRVYTIAVGSKQSLPYRDPMTGRVGTLDYEMDAETLIKIADATGGKFFEATNAKKLKEVYEQIDQMETYKISTTTITRRQERYLPFALLAFCLIGIELILRRTVFRSIP
ncbi:vWA domain-containing protein [Dysgonomonas massiliensis]|uniref:vWA domain-containing protein n=1 Tax=Dysgonomonas massiliensis TaxID=2040292 RepID=UPI000C78A12E|nr:VWA domain-containing protein [Dysgonomonas massiliensis]